MLSNGIKYIKLSQKDNYVIIYAKVIDAIRVFNDNEEEYYYVYKYIYESDIFIHISYKGYTTVELGITKELVYYPNENIIIELNEITSGELNIQKKSKKKVIL